MPSKIVEKVVVYLYEDKTDIAIARFLSDTTRRRNFSNKIKDILYEYININHPEYTVRELPIAVTEVEKEDRPKNEINKILSDWDEE